MTQQTDFLRTYHYEDERDGRPRTMKVNYKVYLEDNKIVDIRNEYGFSVEKNSDVWDHITTIHNSKPKSTS